jgi:hypothetical protein
LKTTNNQPKKKNSLQQVTGAADLSPIWAIAVVYFGFHQCSGFAWWFVKLDKTPCCWWEGVGVGVNQAVVVPSWVVRCGGDGRWWR